MQKQAENSNKSTKSIRKYIIIMLIALAAISAWFSKDFVSKNFKNLAFKPVENITQPPQNQKTPETWSNDQEGVSPNEERPSDPKSAQELGKDNTVLNKPWQPLSKSLIEIDSIDTFSETKGNVLIHLDNYRVYLLNISNLISNFLQDKNYSSQIAYARMVSLPPSINEILELLEEYNINYLVTPSQQYENINFENYKFVKKFFKIKKLTRSAKDKKQLHANITSNLELFQDYIYSNELQKIFIGQRE